MNLNGFTTEATEDTETSRENLQDRQDSTEKLVELVVCVPIHLSWHYALSSANKLTKHTSWIWPEPDRGSNPKHDKKCQDNELRELERLLGLRRSDCFQRRYFFERLHDPDEHIKIKRNHSRNDENPTPMAGKLVRVTREECNREYNQRHDSQRNRRRETMKWKEEPGHAGQHSGDQKPSGPIIQSLAREHSEQNDQASKDPGQANQHVNDRVDAQYHGLPITFFSTSNVTSPFGL